MSKIRKDNNCTVRVVPRLAPISTAKAPDKVISLLLVMVTKSTEIAVLDCKRAVVIKPTKAPRTGTFVHLYKILFISSLKVFSA